MLNVEDAQLSEYKTGYALNIRDHADNRIFERPLSHRTIGKLGFPDKYCCQGNKSISISLKSPEILAALNLEKQ